MSAHDIDSRGPLAIICGGGVLPFAVADAALSRGRKVVLFALEGIAEANRVSAYPHHWIRVAQAGALFAGLRQAACHEIVLIGSLVRPSVWSMRLDLATMMLLPKIVSAMRGGDNHLLSAFARVLERNGFRVVGAQEVAPEILVQDGDLTKRKPQSGEIDDILRGLAVLSAIGPYDVGQGVVVANQHVLAVEGVEGTDAMLARIADLRRSGKVTTASGRGVLIKAPKPHQDRRLDMPAIGPKTVEAVSAAGLAGIAVVAGSTLLAEPERTIAAADKVGIFVTGVRAPAS
jgi:DUF1009 family protein